MADNIVEQLAAVEVQDPTGGTVRLGTLWESRPIILAMIRHFGWIFCKEQVAQLRDFVPEVHEAGGEIVILGNGSPEQAAWFVEDYHIEMPVFTDLALASHAIVGARKPWMLDPRSIARSLEAMRHGFRQTKVMGSAMQLGGVFVLTPDGRMPYKYLSRFAGDHPDPREAVAALVAETKAVPAVWHQRQASASGG